MRSPRGRFSTRWIVATAAMAVLSVLFTLVGAACALVSLAFFDDPAAPGAYVRPTGAVQTLFTPRRPCTVRPA